MDCFVKKERLYPRCTATAVQIELSQVVWNLPTRIGLPVTQIGMKPSVHALEISKQLADVVLPGRGARHGPLDEI
jgi:hypothetical protein